MPLLFTQAMSSTSQWAKPVESLDVPTANDYFEAFILIERDSL